MAKGKDYKNALQEAGPQGGSSHLIVPRKLHCPLGFSIWQDGDSGNGSEMESKVESKSPKLIV